MPLPSCRRSIRCSETSTGDDRSRADAPGPRQLDRMRANQQGSGVARLTPDNEQRAHDLIALYPYSRSALIPILHVLQEQDGYLSEDGIGHVGELLGLTAAEVRGTASF